jgi:iron-sulfur cluster assembly protein
VLTITDQALEKAKEILNAEGKADWGIRVFLSESGCCGPSYGMDIEQEPSPGDEVIEREGLKLIVDKQAYESLRGYQIDFIDDGQQQGFVIRGTEPPSCGCGSSC